MSLKVSLKIDRKSHTKPYQTHQFLQILMMLVRNFCSILNGVLNEYSCPRMSTLLCKFITQKLCFQLCFLSAHPRA